MFDADLTVCPVCNNNSLECGEMIDVGWGCQNGVKGGPDVCRFCGYVEQGPDPEDFPIEHYSKCWELQLKPQAPFMPQRRRALKFAYAEWIVENVGESCLGKCLRTSLAMLKAFPGLRLVEGKYSDFSWGEREHFWLVDEEDYIIDPTARQFPSRGDGGYFGRLVPAGSSRFDEKSQEQECQPFE